MNSALCDFIRLFAEIVVDELLAEQRDGAGIPTTQQVSDTTTVREGNPNVYEKLKEPLLAARP